MCSRSRRTACRAALLALAGLIFVAGCGYPRVSPAAVELTKTIDTVCNLRTEAQIEPARKLVQERYEEGKISEEESEILEQILSIAENGRWESAAARCRSLLEAQTTPSPL